MLWRIRAVPPAREASSILDGLDSGGRLIASGRTLVDTLGTVELTPRIVAGVVRDWVAAEAAGFRAGAGGRAGAAAGGAARRPARRARRGAGAGAVRARDDARRPGRWRRCSRSRAARTTSLSPPPALRRCAPRRPRTCARSRASASATANTRAAGTPGYDASVDYVAGRLRAAGYRVRLQDVPFPVFRDRSQPRLVAGGRRLPVADAALLGARARARAGRAGRARLRRAAELRRRARPDRGRRARHAARSARRRGNARGARARAGSWSPTARATTPPRGSLIRPGLDIPSVAAGRAALQLQGPRASSWSTPSPTTERTRNVIAERPGRRRRVAMVGAHLDSVREGPGINDNGSGVAVTLALAERLRGERGLRFGVLGRGGARALRLAPLRRVADAAASASGSRATSTSTWSARPTRCATSTARAGCATRSRRRCARASCASSRSASAGAPTTRRSRARGSRPPGSTRARRSARPRRQARAFGGRAGRPLDPCYHQRCDTLERVDRDVMTELGEAAGEALQALG